MAFFMVRSTSFTTVEMKGAMTVARAVPSIVSHVITHRSLLALRDASPSPSPPAGTPPPTPDDRDLTVIATWPPRWMALPATDPVPGARGPRRTSACCPMG